jgi:glycogen synthase
MRIALVSFEFPPDTAYGGIASYMHEVALMLAAGGHDVEVFSAGPVARESVLPPGVPVHTVAGLDKDAFAEAVLPVFTSRHEARPFDVVECAEIYADGRALRRRFPGLPLLVKLHTPSFLTHLLNQRTLTLFEKLRFFLGSVRRGRLAWPKPDLSVLHQRNTVESALYHAADVVVSPSRDLIRLIEAEWGRRPDGIGHLPNPHSPSEQLLRIPCSPPREPLLYLGRLEMRKGFSDLINALALLEKTSNPASARFVGLPFPSPRNHLLMDAWAATRLPLKSGRYTFTGQLPRQAAVAELEGCGLVVLPSRWENFPYTCLESMSAGRVVIGSSAGGMSDMITDGVDGFLVQPGNPRVLADKIVDVLGRPEQLATIGAKARERVLAAYSPSAILPQQIAAYQKAIHAARQRSA